MTERKYRRESLSVLLESYFQVLQQSPLADKSVEDYYYFAFCFVRWCNGEFTPGGAVNK